MRNILVMIDGTKGSIEDNWTWFPKFRREGWPINSQKKPINYIDFHWLNIHISIDNEQ